MNIRKKGFTLIELIVVIAILVILAALALPQYNSMKDESNRVVCNSNIEVLTRLYLAETALHPNESASDAYDRVKADNPTAKCPLDNAYTVSYAADGGITVTCPEHGNKSIGGIDIENGKVSAEVKDNYSDLLADISGMTTQQLREYFKAIGYDVPPFTYVSNDNILNYLYDNIYGGSWPEMNKAYYESLGLKCGDKQLYIRPFCQQSSDMSDPGKVFAFANTSNQATSAWNNTYMVYLDGSWYKRPDGKNFGVAGASYDSLKNEIEKGELVPAK